MTDYKEQVIGLIRENARAGTLPGHLVDMPLNAETRIEDLGIDSLGKLTLMTSLMEMTDTYLTDENFRDSSTLAEIVELITEHQ